MALIQNKITIPATYAIELKTGDATKHSNWSLSVGTEAGVSSYAALEFSVNSSDFGNLVSSDEDITVTGIEIHYQYYAANVNKSLSSIIFTSLTSQPSDAGTSVADLITEITGAASYETQSISGYSKVSTSIEITDVVETALQTAIDQAVEGTDSWVGVGVSSSDTSVDGKVSVGGTDLVYGEGESWRVADSEPADPPFLTITYTIEESPHVQLDMRYTTVDPASSQNTPSNSIGGFISPSSNKVYDEFQLGEFLNTTETDITIDSTADLSDIPASGLIQVGPEVAKYTSVNRSTNVISGVTRHISPISSFPSSMEPYPEYVHVLKIDELFDTNPTEELVQYRCVVIQNIGSKTATNVSVFLRQVSTSPVQIDIGIEVPEFDSQSGIHTGAAATSIADDTTFVGNSPVEEKYNGAAIIVGSNTGIIDYFDVDPDGTGSETVMITFVEPFSVSPSDTYRILPARSQRIVNETESPEVNEFFQGFINKDEASNTVSLSDHGSFMQPYDLFYLWIKKTSTRNISQQDPTGAIVMIKFEEVA